MKIWKHTPFDAILLALSVGHFVTTLWLAAHWERFSSAGRVGSFALLVFMMVYNIIVISHLFTHTPWFQSQLLNGLVSMLNSINIGQSVQAYQLTHVRNHHRFNNDQPGPDGTTRDTTSTYRKGRNGRHRPLLPYAVGGAIGSLGTRLLDTVAVVRLWRVGGNE